MVWKVAKFTDLSVQSVPKIWIRVKRGKTKCWWPSSKIAKHIRKQTVPDENSPDWTLHNCTILMNEGVQ